MNNKLEMISNLRIIWNSDEWIKKRLTGVVDRFKLTDIWKDGGIEKLGKYAMLTNEIYKG